MGRKRLPKNKDLPERLVHLIYLGTHEFKQIQSKVVRHQKSLYRYLQNLVKHEYISCVKDNYYLREDVEWCAGCRTIQDKYHPIDWCGGDATWNMKKIHSRSQPVNPAGHSGPRSVSAMDQRIMRIGTVQTLVTR